MPHCHVAVSKVQCFRCLPFEKIAIELRKMNLIKERKKKKAKEANDFSVDIHA